MNGLTGTIAAGLDIALPGGSALAVSGDYGGIGANGQSYGVQLRFSAPLD